jgi:hypothetical protein
MSVVRAGHVMQRVIKRFVFYRKQTIEHECSNRKARRTRESLLFK